MPKKKSKKAVGGKKKKKGGKKKKGDGVGKDSIMRDAIATAKLWEARYHTTEQSRLEYRTNTKRLVSENEQLQQSIAQGEKDNIQVIAFLRRESAAKDEDMASLHRQLKAAQLDAQRQKEQLVEEYGEHIHRLEDTIATHLEQIVKLQNELNSLKEFSRKKSSMQQEIERFGKMVEEMQIEHEQSQFSQQQQFLEEKYRLQKEAERKISELSKNAHAEAVSNLSMNTKEVYRKNLQMIEALSLHIDDTDRLKKDNETMLQENKQLKVEKELGKGIVEKKVLETRQQQSIIKQLEEKVHELEQSLTAVVHEFDEDKHRWQINKREEEREQRAEMETVKRSLELLQRENKHLRSLGRKILQQRSDVEQFLLDSLNEVRGKIALNRNDYCKAAALAYHEQFASAQKGKCDFPKIRTFKANENSTNSVHHDLLAAEKWHDTPSKEDLAKLTWEQREHVLRLLFSKINSS